ncbi:MAG: biotin/lipoate A/B protein ligase family protein [Saprospiraceae bacterium]
MNTWRYIEEDKVTAYYGLAADEYLMDLYSDKDAHKDAILRLYSYQDFCSLVGRFQNVHAELDLESCKRQNSQFTRRLTGGGAIIMGDGQLALCLATANTFQSENTRELYQLFSNPIIQVLDQLGINAELKGKNDLEVDGKKIAGLGIHVNPHGAIQFHTSLLVDLDIPKMMSVLNIPLQKIGDKAQIHKVEQRITTISRELGRKVTVAEVRILLKKCYESQFEVKLVEDAIRNNEKGKIEKIANDRYKSDGWIFQNSPQPDMTGMGLKKTKAGLLRTYVALKGETMKSVLITGDFFGFEELFGHIETKLKWHPIDQLKIKAVIDMAFAKYPKSSDLSADEVFDSIWRATMGAMREVKYTYNGSCYYPKKKEKDKTEKKNEDNISVN